MPWRILLLAALAAGLGFLPVRAADPPDAKKAERVARLVAQLGSATFGEREAASQALDALGADSLDALRAAASSPDAEARRRAEDLVQRIERRLETARLLAPKRVRLVYKDTPLSQAVDDFARKTGYTLQLDGDRNRLQRTVTLDTGDTTFWQALQQFCDRAGLVERRTEVTGQDPRLARAQRGNVIDLRQAAAYTPDPRIYLADGKAPPVPTCYFGALRLRAHTATASPPGYTPDPGEVLFGLEVTPEPGVSWQTVLGLYIDRAVDEQGRELAQAMSYVGGSEQQPLAEDVFIIVDGEVPLPPTGLRHFPVRLKKGPQPSKVLKELKGTITAQMLTPPEPLITVDHILAAEGQIHRGRDGTVLKVNAVTRQENGPLQLRIEVVSPPRDPFGLAPRGARIVRVNRGFRARAIGVPLEGNEPILSLVDAKGQKLRPERCEYESINNINGSTREFFLTYQPEAGLGEPAKLIFNGRRCAVVEVPFTLRDVPLPP
jgi:hypothetical protein